MVTPLRLVRAVAAAVGAFSAELWPIQLPPRPPRVFPGALPPDMDEDAMRAYRDQVWARRGEQDPT